MQRVKVLFVGFQEEERRILLPAIEKTCLGMFLHFTPEDAFEHPAEIADAFDLIVLRARSASAIEYSLGNWRSVFGKLPIFVCADQFDPAMVLGCLNGGAQRVIPFAEIGSYLYDCILAFQEDHKFRANLARDHFAEVDLDISEDADRASEKRLNAILKNSPIGIGILSSDDGRIVKANDRMGLIFERHVEELVGTSVVDLGLELSLEKFLDELERQAKKAKNLCLERVVISGKKRKIHVSFTAGIVDLGREREILLLVEDITERTRFNENNRKVNDDLGRKVLERTAELEAVNRELQQEIGFRKSIEQSSQRLTQIIWETPDIVAICDLFGRMLYLNKAGRRVLGLNDQESISHLVVYSFYPPEAEKFITEILTKIVNREGYWYGETDLLIGNGKTIPTSQVILAHRDINGEVQFYSTIARDISTQLIAANQVKQAYEKEKELGIFRSNFFTMTSHQFRTPLSTILSSAELLENYGSQWIEEKRLTHINRIKESTQRLNTMLNDILFIGRMDVNIENISVEYFALDELIEGLIRNALSTDNHRHGMRMINPGDPVMIHTASVFVERILDNLISNAIKYSNWETEIEIRLSAATHGAMICVEDHGIGISESDLNLVFQPFHRGGNVVDMPGNGLGLMIVEKSLELIQGRIKIESELGFGTIVTIFLPDLQK